MLSDILSSPAGRYMPRIKWACLSINPRATFSAQSAPGLGGILRSVVCVYLFAATVIFHTTKPIFYFLLIYVFAQGALPDKIPYVIYRKLCFIKV